VSNLGFVPIDFITQTPKIVIGQHVASLQMESQMITLPKLLNTYSIPQLLDFADRLDPNNGWRESIEEDSSISRDSLYWSMLLAYDDIDTYNWLNAQYA
jgi:hypothetical protein